MCRLKYLIATLGVVFAVAASTPTQGFGATSGWMVNGSMLTGTKALATTAAVDETFRLSFIGVEVNCAGKNLGMANPSINGSTGMQDAGSLEFKSCTSNAVCPLGERQGTELKTLPVLADLTLDGPLAVRGRILPTNSSKVLATIEFGGSECSLSGVSIIDGTEGFLMPAGQDERTQQQVYWAIQSPGELQTAFGPVFIKGSWLDRLVSGEPFSFL